MTKQENITYEVVALVQGDYIRINNMLSNEVYRDMDETCSEYGRTICPPLFWRLLMIKWFEYSSMN